MRAAVSACMAVAFAWAAAGASEAAVAKRSCHVEDFETPATCVTIDVPKDYGKPDGGTISVTAVVIPAATARPSPDPLVLLAGGPGQPASSLAGGLPALLSEVRKTRDVVLFDLRGTGLSSPLHCPNASSLSFFTNAEGPPGPPVDVYAQFGSFARACLAQLGDRVRNHTSYEAVEDLERFRQAMGYPSLNLWGGSFGTRIVQHYVRAYGARTRSVVLDAVAPVGLSVLASGAQTADTALEAVLVACEKDAACGARFPTFRNDLAVVLGRLDTASASGVLPEPVSGVRGRFSIGRGAAGNAIRIALYAKTTTELLPFAVAEAAKDNWAPIFGIASAASDDTLAFGAQFSMLCAEDWRQAAGLDPGRRTGKLMLDGFFRIFSEACEIWPTTDALPPGMLAPFRSEAPALAISGAHDPVTPPALAEQALEQFPNGRHLVLANGFHTNSASPCIARIIARFLDDPADRSEEACIARMPSLHFFLGAPDLGARDQGAGQ